MEKILVTGGAGFIGSHLSETLLRSDYKVRILDNLSTGKKKNLEEVSGQSLPNLSINTREPFLTSLGKKAEFLFGDISDLETCRMACRGISFVFHLAALGSVQRSVEDPIASHRANATGTLNILQAAKEAKVRRVVYASSSSVYGNLSSDPEGVMPKREDFPPNPQSPYAATKLAGEQYCRIFASLYGLETVSLRFFNVFGPRQDPNSLYAAVIPRFITALLTGQSPHIFGDGNQSRDFTYVENVVSANLLAAKTPGISGEVFNIACGRQTTVITLLSSLQGISGRNIPPQYEEARSGEVRHSLSSIELAKAHLGYTVKVDLEEGLRGTWKWFQKKGGTPG
jgi:nucleoside-diphosphate-sugar epimerase